MKPPSLSPYFFTSFERHCTPLTQNSMLKCQSSSHMPCFSLPPAKRHPSGGAKQWKQRVLNQESQKAMTTWFIFLVAEPFNFNFFHVCTYCSELIVAPLFKNFNNKNPSLSHKTLTITWYTAVCTFHSFSLIVPTVPICNTPTFFLAPWKMDSKDTILQLTTKAQMQPAWRAFLLAILKLPLQKRGAWMYNRNTFSLYSNPVPPKPCTPLQDYTVSVQWNPQSEFGFRF